MAFEYFIIDPDSEWNEGVMIEEYNSVFSVVAATKSKTAEGTIYKKWGFPQNKDKQPIAKAIPWKVRLGSKRRAVEVLQQLLDALRQEAGDPGPDDIEESF